MKKPYVKPMAAFENYSLDMPIASGCSPNTAGIVAELKNQFFFSDDSCVDQISDNSLDQMYGDDKICYYTLAEKLFTS